MPQTPAQRRASDRAAAWLAERQVGNAWLAVQSNVDPDTIGAFLNGQRWPKIGTQGKIERALGWPFGSIRQIGNGALPDDVGALLHPADDLESPPALEELDGSYVTAPGERADSSVTNADVLAAIERMTKAIEEMNAKLDRGGHTSGDGSS